MAGKYHTDALAYSEGRATPAMLPGRLVQAYVQGYQNGVAETEPAPKVLADGEAIEAYQAGSLDAADGLNPGFTAEVAPEPPPDPPPEAAQ